MNSHLSTVVCPSKSTIFDQPFRELRFRIVGNTDVYLYESTGIIALCWVAGSLVGFLPLLGWHRSDASQAKKCFFTQVMDYNYLVFLYFFTIVFPAVLLVAFYAHIYTVVLAQVRNPLRSLSKSYVTLCPVDRLTCSKGSNFICRLWFIYLQLGRECGRKSGYLRILSYLCNSLFLFFSSKRKVSGTRTALWALILRMFHRGKGCR